MSSTTWTEADTEEALRIWANYQSRHDLSGEIGRTAGIDPATGRVWFGESAADIWRQRQAEGAETPVYCVRVGFGYYLRKGRRRYVVRSVRGRSRLGPDPIGSDLV